MGTAGPLSTPVEVTPSSSRRRATITLADQLVSSGSNFVVGAVVAGVGLRSLGGYGLAFTVWLLLLVVPRAVLTEPLLLRYHPHDRDRMASGVSADLLLGVAAMGAVGLLGGLLIAAGSETFGSPLLCLALCAPVLLLQDYWRAMAFKQQRPQMALVNDVVFAVVQLGVLAALAWNDAVTANRAIGAWGLGAAVAVVVGFGQFKLWPARGGVRLLRAEWFTGRWLLADATTQFVADQSYALLAGAVLGAADFGGLQAALRLVGPVVVLLLAVGNVGLPEAARRYATSGGAGLNQLVSRFRWYVVGCVGAYAAFVMVFAGPLLRAYGRRAEYVHYSNVTRLIALQYVFVSVVFCEVMALKVAGRARSLWGARIVVAAFSMVAAVVLTTVFGLAGAGWTSALTGAAYALLVHRVYRRSGLADAVP